MLAQNAVLAANDIRDPISIGAQGLTSWYQTYFNGRNVSPYNYGADRNLRRDRYHLEDSDRMLEDLGTVIRKINMERFTWVNSLLLPARETEKLEEEITILNFGDIEFLEQTPAEAASRYVTMKKEKVTAKMKRYGLGAYFEVDRMMTQEGLEDYAHFVTHISNQFRIHAAFLGLSRLVQPHDSEKYWYAQFKELSENLSEYELQREVAEFGCAHKSETGIFELIWKYAKAMQTHNGKQPNFVIFNPEKQALFKFGNKMLSEYYRAGEAGPDRVLGFEELGSIQGMSFRGLPSFTNDVTEDSKEAQFLMQDAQIGNKFVFRRRVFVNYGVAYKNGVHNYLDLFSEQKDGLHRIWEREFLVNSGRFDTDGSLHPDHDQMLNQYPTLDDGESLDIFAYYDRDLHRFRKCHFLGDMEPKYLDKSVMRHNIAIIKSQIGKGLDNEFFRRLTQQVAAPTGAANGYIELIHRMVEFINQLSERLGGDDNPVFEARRVRMNTGTENFKRFILFMENCCLYKDPTWTTEPGSRVAKFDHLSEDKLNLVFSEVKRQYQEDLEAGRITEPRQETLKKLFLYCERFYQGANVVAVSNEAYKGIRSAFDITLAFIAHPRAGVPGYLSDAKWPVMERLVSQMDFLSDHHEVGVMFEGDFAKAQIVLQKTRHDLGRPDLFADHVKPYESVLGTVEGLVASVEKDVLTRTDKKKSTIKHGSEAVDDEFSFMSKRTTFGAEATRLSEMARPDGETLPTRLAAPFTTLFTETLEQEGEAPYDVDHGMFGQNMATVSFVGGTSMQANLTWVMRTFSDVFDRAIGLAMLMLPIRMEALNQLIAHNLHFPCDYIGARPWMEYLMSGCLLASGGKELGETLVGYGHVGLGTKIVNKTMDFHSTQWMAATVYNYALRCVIRFAFYERAYGGGGHYFYTEEEYDSHVQNDFHSEGLDRPSLLSMMIPMDSYVKEDYISITGCTPGFERRTKKHHYETFRYYNIRYKFGRMNHTHPGLLQDLSLPRTNVVCWQGTQRQCGNLQGDPGEITENKGHHGIERSGDKEIRNRGSRVKQTTLTL